MLVFIIPGPPALHYYSTSSLTGEVDHNDHPYKMTSNLSAIPKRGHAETDKLRLHENNWAALKTIYRSFTCELIFYFNRFRIVWARKNGTWHVNTM